MKTAERYAKVVERFRAEMPVAETELHYDNPYQLLVAVILSAQCTDKRVNMVTPAFFEAFPTPEALAAATPEDVFEKIKSVSYPNNKTRSLLGMARKLVDDYGSEVPDDIDSLMTLPGVGRKTANLLLGDIYHKPAVVCDTHCIRITNKLGLARGKDPAQVERQLWDILPPEESSDFCHRLVLHGRAVCTARTNPYCDKCCAKEWCDTYNKK